VFPSAINSAKNPDAGGAHLNQLPLIVQKASGVLLALATCVISPATLGLAKSQTKDRPFTARVTDSQGIESEIKNIFFYWEEKVSETAFVPHELRDVPVKKGTATIKVRFDQLSRSRSNQPADTTTPTVVIPEPVARPVNFSLPLREASRVCPTLVKQSFQLTV
jgi:hypothetical protein